MGKQKQQVISRFFSPKPPAAAAAAAADPGGPSPSSSSLPSSPLPPTSTTTHSPKITATVAYSPSKRLLSPHFAPSPKPPKIPKPNPTLHQKFLQKLLEPTHNDTGDDVALQKLTSPSRTTADKYTPLERQVAELKAKYPDVLLMVEVGYRYRFFGRDADTASRVLGIYSHLDRSFLTASIPAFRLNVHVRRLVGAGYKVGVVKQTETAAIKAHGSNRLGPFCRGLSALYTKATLEAAEDLAADAGGEEEGCGPDSSYLLCAVEAEAAVENLDCGVESRFDVRIGVVAVEISTGDVVHGEFNDNFMRSGLESVILSLSPAELLLGEPLSKHTEKILSAYAGPASNIRIERASRDCFKDGGALAEVMSLYESMIEDEEANQQELKAEGTEQGRQHLAIEGILAMPALAVQALALTIRHLKQFGFERVLCLGSSFRPFSSNAEMTLSGNALQQLEVLKNNSDGSESGSLFQAINHTFTIFGSRLLRHWVIHPLCDRNMICARLDAVSEILEYMGSSKDSNNSGGLDEEDREVSSQQPEAYFVLSSVLTALGRLPDIQRGITRIFHRTATASEFIAVIQAILCAGKQLQRLNLEEEGNNIKMQPKAVNSVLLRKLILIASSSSITCTAAKLLSSLNKEAADKRDLLNLFSVSDGQFPEVAKARMAVQFAKEKLDLLINSYRKQLRMRDLEFMSVSGTSHLIELPLDVKVPLNWLKVNSTKKTIRYHPPEVLTALDDLALANEELTVACRTAWASFLRAFGKYYSEFQAAVQALAALDCLHSLAVLAKNKNYVCPAFVDDDEPVQIIISSGRHPVLEIVLEDSFVPNDTNLHAEAESCYIITGPNMGGKSCYIRQVALICIMAQVGSFVPAASAKLHVLDGIHTRMGASDSIQQGRSTFLEELSETSHIVNTCTERSLVIMDELGRGTSTHDGAAIAYATLHHFLEQKRCMILFVTHYPKIVDIKSEFPGRVAGYHVSYLTSRKNVDIIHSNGDNNVELVDHDDVTYLYKLVPGISERSFGFKVAELAQLPSSCIHRATVMAAKLESVVSNRVGNSMSQKLIPSYEEQTEQDGILKPPNYSGTGGLESMNKLTNAFTKFLLNLNSALGNDDFRKGFEFLKCARTLAEDLIIL